MLLRSYIDAVKGIANASVSLIVLIAGILVIVFRWKMFEKAGVEGWKAVVPILQTWNRAKIASMKDDPNILLFIAVYLPVLGPLFMFYLSYKFAKAYNTSTGLAIFYALFPFFGGLIIALSEEYQYQGTEII